MNILFMVALIVEAIFGLGFLLAPYSMMAPYGVSLDENAATFARLFGSALASFSFLLWFARRSEKHDFKIGVIYSLFAYFLLSTIILLGAQLAGLMNAMGWVVIAIHVVFVVWFGYYLRK
jgi:hypothetical protein